MSDILQGLKDESYTVIGERVPKLSVQQTATKSTGEATLTLAVQELQPRQVAIDPHLENVISFAAGTDLHDHPLYASGQLILQQKVGIVL